MTGAVIRFEFRIREGKTTRWVQIQGRGGQLGSNILYRGAELTGVTLEKAKMRLLIEARSQQRLESVLRLWHDDREWHDRIELVHDARIETVREVRGDT